MKENNKTFDLERHKSNIKTSYPYLFGREWVWINDKDEHESIPEMEKSRLKSCYHTLNNAKKLIHKSNVAGLEWDLDELYDNKINEIEKMLED